MDAISPDLVLDMPPDADVIRQLRQQASEASSSAVASFDKPGAGPFYLVVSDRGTCVLLRDGVSVDTMNRTMEPDEVATAVEDAT